MRSETKQTSARTSFICCLSVQDGCVIGKSPWDSSSPEYDSTVRAILQGLQEGVERRTRTIETTKFGDLFLQVCLPEDLALKGFQTVLKTEQEEKF